MNEDLPIVPMNLVHQNGHRFLLSASRTQLFGIANALNEICNGIHIADAEFEARLGSTRQSSDHLRFHWFIPQRPARTYF